MRSLRICLVITEDWYFWSHRRSLAQFLVAQGHEVHLITRLSSLQREIQQAGIATHEIGLQRSSKNPWREALAVRRMTAAFQRIRPDTVHLVGMKPILYGSLAARGANIPAVICAIAGLGWLFTSGGMAKAFARHLVSIYFRQALAANPRVGFILQNPHHREVLVRKRMASPDQIQLISGAGVNTQRFRMRPEPPGRIKVLTHARMLWDKGIGDLVEAAKILKAKRIPCDISLVGDPDPANPASIPTAQLQQWNAAGIVAWQPRRDDIPELLAQHHIACLPSYHEGFPLSVVEAMSCGRPVVTTDIPGCKDAITHESTGLLVPPRQPPELAAALSRLVTDELLRRRMGQAARRDVLQRMASQVVNQQTISCYQELLQHQELPAPWKEAA